VERSGGRREGGAGERIGNKVEKGGYDGWGGGEEGCEAVSGGGGG